MKHVELPEGFRWRVSESWYLGGYVKVQLQRRYMLFWINEDNQLIQAKATLDEFENAIRDAEKKLWSARAYQYAKRNAMKDLLRTVNKRDVE